MSKSDEHNEHTINDELAFSTALLSYSHSFRSLNFPLPCCLLRALSNELKQVSFICEVEKNQPKKWIFDKFY